VNKKHRAWAVPEGEKEGCPRSFGRASSISRGSMPIYAQLRERVKYSVEKKKNHKRIRQVRVDHPRGKKP